MSEESKQEEKVILMPTTDDIPEKFRGKPITEVLKSYSEVEKLIGSKGEEIGGIKKELEIARQALEAPEVVEEEPADSSTEYDYMTLKDMNKRLKEQEDNFESRLKKVTEETSTQTNWEFEKRQFLSQHKELDAKAVETIALIGIQNGHKTLDESYESFVQFAGKVGLNANTENPRIVSSNMSGVQEETNVEGEKMFDENWMKRAKAGASGIAGTLK